MSYIDGFVLAVPSAHREAFIEQARAFDSELMALGARRILECWGDDVPVGKLTDFRRAVAATDDETVVFSWIEWPDKVTRDLAHARMAKLVESDPRFKDKPMVFDGRRLIHGGFTPVVEL